MTAGRLQTIGLIGGMSWISTIAYYRIINETVNAALGGLHSARIVLVSVDFDEIETHQRAGRWNDAGEILGDAAKQLERAGADFAVLCTNTMHRVAEHIERAASLPMLHIADATAVAVRASGIERIGLIGTRYTMEETFYRDRLERDHGLTVLIPDEPARLLVNATIYDELCHGEIRGESRAAFAAVSDGLVQQGAQGIILGCTEVGLLIRREDTQVPLFDTCRIHAEAAARQALPGRGDAN